MYRIFIALLFLVVGLGISQGIIKVDLQGVQKEITQVKEMILDKLFPEERKIAMPKIPKIKRNAKSTSGFSAPTPQPQKSAGKKDSNDKEQVKREREDNFHFVHEVYQAVLEAKPTSTQASQWMNVLDQGGSREGVYRALVLSDQYAGLENFDPTSSDQVVQFTAHFLSTYLDQGVDEDQLSNINSYSIKRIVTEQSLELVDTFVAENDRDSASRWYAIVSSDIAARYPSLWELKLRKSNNPRIHLNWAKRVSNQTLKSELMIKIHRVYNHLDGR